MDSVASAAWQEAEAIFRSDPDRAKALCQQVLSRTPAFWGAHWMLSRILQAQCRFRLAVGHARASARCLDERSTPHEILLVSSSLISVGEYGACMRLLAELNPGMSFNSMQITGLVEQLMMLDAPESALPWLEFAERAGFNDAALLQLRGNAQKFIGNLAEAALSYEQAIKLDPWSSRSHYALATLDLEEGRRERIARLERIVGGKVPVRALPALCYALFRELDQAGDPDKAWPHLERAMALRKMESRYSATTENTIFDHIIDALRPVSSLDDGVERVPVFIMGLPRSGTTVVERILGNHPDVASCGELSELRMAYKWASDYYCEGFLDLHAARLLSAVDAGLVGKLYMQSTQWRTSGRRWHTDKHPGNIVLAGLAFAAMPQARIINVRRESIDSCFGCLRELFAADYYDYSYSFDDVVNHYGNYSRLMRRLELVDPKRIMHIDYEDMVGAPQEAAQRLLAACGLPPMQGVHDITANSQPVTTASSVQVRSPIHTKRVGYWRRYEHYLRPLQSKLEALSETDGRN